MESVFKPIASRTGVFAGCTVHGELREKTEGGARAWLITFFEEGSPGSTDYWVSGNEIREVLHEIWDRTSPSHTFKVGPIVEDVPLAKKQAIVQAIKSWEDKAANS